MTNKECLEEGAHKVFRKLHGEGAAVDPLSIIMILSTVLPLLLRCFNSGLTATQVATNVKDLGPFQRIRLRRACIREADSRREGLELYEATVAALESSSETEIYEFCEAARIEGETYELSGDE